MQIWTSYPPIACQSHTTTCLTPNQIMKASHRKLPCNLGYQSLVVPILHPSRHPSPLVSWHLDLECVLACPSLRALCRLDRPTSHDHPSPLVFSHLDPKIIKRKENKWIIFPKIKKHAQQSKHRLIKKPSNIHNIFTDFSKAMYPKWQQKTQGTSHSIPSQINTSSRAAIRH